MDPEELKKILEEQRIANQQAAKQAAEQAREEERRKANDEITKAHKAREDLEKELNRRDEEQKRNALSSLPVEQQITARLSEMERSLANERAERAKEAAMAREQIRNMGLLTYRERALRDVPAHVHPFVTGQSEEEIDAAAEYANQTYQAIQAQIRAELEAQFNAGNSQYMVPGAIVAPPPNPAYVAQPYAPNAGFPTATNPLPVTQEESPVQEDIREYTSEQAVRSGKYSKEIRDQILGSLKGTMRYPGQLGTNPRNPAPPQMPYQQMPGGVQQPMGTPMGPVQNSQQYQVPQHQMPQQQAGNDPRAMAAAAVQRTLSGQNPVVAGDSAAQNALNAANAHAQARGLTSQTAFQGRFQHTAPIAPPSGGRG